MNNDWREYTGDPSYLAHHGIKGQKWGIRRFQNADGSLTAEGKAKYGANADKVEKFARKSASWENRAANAKTSIGRGISTSMATWRRQKADKVGAKATGDYKMLALNKNTARNARAAAETNANIAAKTKAKADAAASGSLKQKILMERAIKNLSSAENSETMGAKYEAVSKAKFITKAGVYINKTMKETTYSPAGRAKSMKDRVAESIGDAIISSVVSNSAQGVNNKIDENIHNDTANKAAKIGVNVATKVASKGAVSGGRDVVYKAKNSQSDRWDKILKDKK